jgi:nucleoid DNA-binding protein
MSKSAGKAEKGLTKSQILANLSEKTELAKKDVVKFFEALEQEIKESIGKKGPGQFTIPGLCKIVVINKPALPKRQVRKPGTNEMVWAEPKPARKVVKVRPLKGLKDMVS